MIVQDMLDEGNWIIRDTFKSQAQRNPQIIKDANKTFDMIYEKLAKLEKFNNTAFEKEQIAKNKEAAKTYQATMNSFLLPG